MLLRRIINKFVSIMYGNEHNFTRLVHSKKLQDAFDDSVINDSIISSKAKLYKPCLIGQASIGDYSYVSLNSRITQTTIGKFCSIGPNFLCGWGIHPTDGISTSPMFYSLMNQHGVTLSSTNKLEERKRIIIGNDVFLGANVTVLDGVTIGDGAVIGAGAVVSKDIPPYAIAVGCPIKIMRFRMNENQIEAMSRIKWWNFDEERLKDVEKMFFDIDGFIKKYDI